MEIKEENMTNDKPSGGNDLPGDITVVTLCPTPDDATTLTEGDGKSYGIIPRDYLLEKC